MKLTGRFAMPEPNATLQRSDLRLLAAWCRPRGIAWLPAAMSGTCPALWLTPPGRGTEAMLLVLGHAELRLHDAAGQELAAASDLPALLDALDGGVADPPVPAGWNARPVQARAA
jgi:hypothetical protein